MARPPAIACHGRTVQLISKGPHHFSPVSDRLAQDGLAGRGGQAEVHGHDLLEDWSGEAIGGPRERELPGS